MIYTGNLPVLAELVQNNTTDFGQVSLFVIQHITKNTVEFIRLLKTSGFRDITVIGKPYSVDKEALKVMERFTKVIIPTLAQLERVNYIGLVMQKVIKKQPYLCFDMGGHFSKYFQSLSTIPKGLLGVIEETKNGLWFDPSVLRIPLISVASAQLKNYGEVCFVARAIVRSSEQILINEFQQTLAGKNILLLGFGMIGKSLALLLNTQASVSVYDILPSLRVKAKIDGFSVLKNPSHLSEFDVIIGTTGVFALKKELSQLKPGVILVNGSTRRREYDFRAISKRIQSRVDYQRHTKISLGNGKVLYLLAHGYPVNFFQTESVPEYVLDLLYSEMFLLADRMITSRFKAGFYRIEEYFPQIEEKIASIWLTYWGK